jgi:hypothetical protein
MPTIRIVTDFGDARTDGDGGDPGAGKTQSRALLYEMSGRRARMQQHDKPGQSRNRKQARQFHRHGAGHAGIGHAVFNHHTGRR